MNGPCIDFRRVALAAASHSDAILRRWLPNGRREGCEWVVRNPTRSDRRPGSFKINVKTGVWADFASGASGGDLTSLAAYLFAISQVEAAKRIAAMLGIDPHVR
jgi:hypothetical protein